MSNHAVDVAGGSNAPRSVLGVDIGPILKQMPDRVLMPRMSKDGINKSTSVVTRSSLGVDVGFLFKQQPGAGSQVRVAADYRPRSVFPLSSKRSSHRVNKTGSSKIPRPRFRVDLGALQQQLPGPGAETSISADHVSTTAMDKPVTLQSFRFDTETTDTSDEDASNISQVQMPVAQPNFTTNTATGLDECLLAVAETTAGAMASHAPLVEEPPRHEVATTSNIGRLDKSIMDSEAVLADIQLRTRKEQAWQVAIRQAQELEKGLANMVDKCLEIFKDRNRAEEAMQLWKVFLLTPDTNIPSTEDDLKKLKEDFCSLLDRE